MLAGRVALSSTAVAQPVAAQSKRDRFAATLNGQTKQRGASVQSISVRLFSSTPRRRRRSCVYTMRSAVATAQRQSLVNFDYNNSTCLIQIDDGEVRQCLRGPHLTADCAVPRKRHKRLDATGRGDGGANGIVAG